MKRKMSMIPGRFIASFMMIMAFVCSFSKAGGKVLPDENLNYVVSYKWGLIHKDAGTARLSLRSRGNNYELTLIGHTKPWADRFYQVRDTLTAVVDKNGFRPKRYLKITHEKGKYAKDEIIYSYAGETVGGNARKYRRRGDGTMKVTEKQLTAAGKAFDMLSVFYYLRLIDYSSLKDGQKFRTTVFSGSKAEQLEVRSAGIEEVKMRDKTKRKAFHVKFKFTMKEGKKSSDDIDCWISVERPHVPLLLVGSLPVGQVRCCLV